MPDVAGTTHYFPFSGANVSVNSRILSSLNYEMACNVVLKEGMPSTRFGCRTVPISGVNTDLEWFAKSNGQGFHFHNPSKGQTRQVFGENKNYIMAAVGGRKFAIEVNGRGHGTKGKIENITNGLETNKQYHLVWWETAENYALANDGNSNLFIWDSYNPAFFSTGYDTEDKLNSKLPNGGTVILYVHNRVAIVVNGRQIIYGDIIHRDNRYSPSNILNATEQVHWATGPFIGPPSSMGDIMAADILPLRNTNHGHRGGLFHCLAEGIFSVNSNIALREEWANTDLIDVADAKLSAAGPYALDVISSDQIFRGTRGVDSLRSSTGEDGFDGNQENGLGDAIKPLLDLDTKSLLRFASLQVWSDVQRLIVTIDHKVRMRWRYARAAMIRNHDPRLSERSAPAWEGMMTLPHVHRNIIQFVSGKWQGYERMFAITREDSGLKDPGEGTNRLAELDNDLQHDYVVDSDTGENSAKDISCWLRTRKLHFEQPFVEKDPEYAKIFFQDVRTFESDRFRFAVFAQSDRCEEWTFYRGGSLKTPRPDILNNCKPYSFDIPLGLIPDEHKKCRWIQFLIKWTGHASIESFLVTAEQSSLDTEMSFDRLDLTQEGKCYDFSCNHKDYEYSIGNAPDWHRYVIPLEED